MKSIFVFIMLVSLLSISNGFKKHFNLLKKPNIIGGEEAKIANVPYIANLNGCGGVIISEKWILTAAHCEEPKEIKVGSRDFTKGDIYQVKESYVHPRFDIVQNEPVFDFRLLEIKKSIEFNERVQPISLGKEEDIIFGANATVSGWGRDDRGLYPIYLRKVNVEIIRDDICEELYGNDLYNKASLCAGSTGKDSCYGDSGGPLVSNGKVIGIVSFGNDCASDIYPGVYSRVSYAREWIWEISGLY